MSEIEVMALRQEVADRHEVQQHDREPERRQLRRAAAAPADRAAREQRERVDAPARRARRGSSDRPATSPAPADRASRCTCVAQMPPTSRPSVRNIQPIDDRPAVHHVEHLQRRQPRVEEAEVLGLDLLEQQHVGDAEDAGEREARVGEQQRQRRARRTAGSAAPPGAARRPGSSAGMTSSAASSSATNTPIARSSVVISM